jgi:hypothetical protein
LDPLPSHRRWAAMVAGDDIQIDLQLLFVLHADLTWAEKTPAPQNRPQSAAVSGQQNSVFFCVE